MSIAKVRAYLSQFQMDQRIQEFESSSATVELAAEALGCEPARIAKSLAFMVADQPVLIVTAGDVRINNAKFRTFFHTKAKMLSPEAVQRLVGHPVGGVCPFALKPGVTVYLDRSLQRFETVFPACGSCNSAIELTIPELKQCSGFKGWVDVCKLPQA